ncbi:MAG: phage head-tail connector protein [Caenispirillum sp.]|nr:phage head-tail connector protein [Caenispirillum sp.]
MLTTLDTVKAELGITDTSLDTYLTRAINAASEQIEGHCGRVFGSRTVSEVFRLDRCRPRIMLNHWPVTAVGSVTEDGAAVPEAERPIEDGIFLRRLDGDGADSLWTAAKIEVSYTAGYVLPAAEGANLPADVEQACIDLVRLRYHAKDRDPALKSEKILDVIAQSWDTGGTDGGQTAAVLATLDRYRRVVIA